MSEPLGSRAEDWTTGYRMLRCIGRSSPSTGEIRIIQNALATARQEGLDAGARERDALLDVICSEEDVFWNFLDAANPEVYDEAPYKSQYTPAECLPWVRKAMGWKEKP